MTEASSTPDRGSWVRANEAEYGPDYARLSFVSPENAAKALAAREALLSRLAGQSRMLWGGSKPCLGELSPGCAICGQGGWSCLFINGRCNGRCFYCPSPQDRTGVPETNGLPFASPTDYVAYLAAFNIQGVGISGGEPFLTFDRTLSFVRAVKKKFGSGVYVWMYTNGILADREKFLALAGAGLDEARFDIGATGLSLSGVRKAAGAVPRVTVEIPAVPEDLESLKAKAPELLEAGVSHLNLHQLRLTPHNLPNLAGRGYTFLHGEKVTVLESELCALEFMAHAAETGLGLCVNYCSFVYKNRYQGAAAKARAALKAVRGHESVTKAGFIRSLCLSGAQEDISRQAEIFSGSGRGQDLFKAEPASGRVFFHPALISLADLSRLSLSAGYFEAHLVPAVSYRHVFQEVRLTRKRAVYVEKRPAGPYMPVPASDVPGFESFFLQESSAPMPPSLASFLAFETILDGLGEYL